MSLKLADVQNQYKKDPKLKRDDVKSLQEWVHKQPHLPDITELQAILFLHSCYYSNEKAKHTIDTYFTVKTICYDIFGNRNPESLTVKNALSIATIPVLPKLTPEGYAVIFFKFLDANPNKFVLTQQMRLFDMAMSLNLSQNGIYEGVVIVVDMEGMVFGHLTRLSVGSIKKFLYYLQEAMPMRLKGFHFINAVSFIDKILALMKPFMKKDLMDMIHIHAGSIESLYKFVPQYCMPQDYGGHCSSIQILHEKLKSAICDNAEYFNFEDKQRVDESKRPEKGKNTGNIFGMEGTFKKLEID